MKEKLKKIYEAYKVSDLRYEFYKICKKYSEKDLEKITGSQLHRWKKKNSRIGKKLEKFKKNIDIAFAMQSMDAIDENLEKVLKYDENGEITKESYIEYLRYKHLNIQVESQIIEDINLATENASNFVECLESNPEELAVLATVRTVRNSIRVVFGAMAAVLAIGSFGSIIMNKKSDNNKEMNKSNVGMMADGDKILIKEFSNNNNEEIANSLNIEEEQATVPGNSIIEEEQATVSGNSIVEEEQTTVPGNNIENQDNKTGFLTETNNIINRLNESAEKNANYVIEKAKELISSLSEGQLVEKSKLENSITNLEQTIPEGNSINIMQATIDLLTDMDSTMSNIQNATDNKSYISVGEAVDTVNDADMYTTKYDLADGVNNKKSYYGSSIEAGRTIDSVILMKEDSVIVSYTNEQIDNYLKEGYEVIGYRLNNQYSYGNDGNHVGYEGFYQDEDITRVLER